MTLQERFRRNKENIFQIFGKDFFYDVTSLVQISASLLIVLAILLILLFRIKPTSSLIPLVYNSTFGVTDLGAWYNIYSYPIAYACFSVLNISIAWAFFNKKRLITYLVLFVHNIIGIVLLIEVYYLTVLIKG